MGNFGDGTINAFNLSTNTFVGQLPGIDGKPLSIDGLWGLIPGNGGYARQPEQDLLLRRPYDESHGLFGAISFVPEPSSVVLGLIAITLVAVGTRWKARRAARAA